MPQSDDDFYDDLLPSFDPEEQKKQQEIAEARGQKIDKLIHMTFAQSDAGQDLLEVWSAAIMMRPTAEPGLSDIEIGIREGRKSFLRDIVLTIAKVEGD